jgi:BirA family transcriptional regulator, biotin operon repressor / biotin---[acetyl-CoA-carboxylase] ligase
LYKIPARTLFLGKNLIFMPECPSTNDAMLLLCQAEASPEGTVVVTARQTAGRGQRGNSWESEAGKNLTFTVLVKPSFLPIDRQFYLNIFVALGIRDYLTDSAGLKVQIKWPNDIVYNQKKIAGVLIENQISGALISLTAIGIGLNINQQQFDSPSAASVRTTTGRDTDLSQALDLLLQKLELRYLELKAGKYEHLLKDYLHNLFRLDELSTYSDHDGVFSGTIRGIDPSGRLLVERSGELRAYDLKAIQYRGELSSG